MCVHVQALILPLLTKHHHTVGFVQGVEVDGYTVAVLGHALLLGYKAEDEHVH